MGDGTAERLKGELLVIVFCRMMYSSAKKRLSRWGSNRRETEWNITA